MCRKSVFRLNVYFTRHNTAPMYTATILSLSGLSFLKAFELKVQQ